MQQTDQDKNYGPGLLLAVIKLHEAVMQLPD